MDTRLVSVGRCCDFTFDTSLPRNVFPHKTIQKECTYGISVDKEKKRVIVLFRGAITVADWSHGFDAALKKGPNPIKEEYAKKTAYLKIHRGFYTYLFRKRKDTGTSKFDEIVNKTYEYGSKMIGDDFTVTTLGFSLVSQSALIS